VRDNGAATQEARVATASTGALRENFVNAHAVIIVRHAYIDTKSKSNTTPLLPRGEERAKELITALKSASVTRIVTSSALRTKETAAPLAAELKIVPEDPFSHAAEGAGAAFAAMPEATTVIRYLSQTAKPEQTILVVQHHSSLPGILAEFGFKGESLMDDATEFDRVYVILPDAGRQTYQLLRLRYGGKW
jgi:broad specificity phosphatase PhoE